MKRKNIIGMLVIAVFVISIVAALMQYKKEQMVAELDEYFEEILTDEDLEFLQVFEDDNLDSYEEVTDEECSE